MQDNDVFQKAGANMTEIEMLKMSIEEFDRLQDYMQSSDKESEAYKKMKRRYTALKVIDSFGYQSY